MRKIVLIIGILLLTNLALADSTACLDNQTAQYNITRINATDSSTLLDMTYNVTCQWNCSTTLQECRWDEYIQMQTFIGIIIISFVIMFFGLWVGRRILMIDFPIYSVMMMFFVLMGGVFDVFIARYQTIFLVMTFVPIGFFFYSLWISIRLRKEARGEKRATGR